MHVVVGAEAVVSLPVTPCASNFVSVDLLAVMTVLAAAAPSNDLFWFMFSRVWLLLPPTTAHTKKK
jgi:hypothetical protein